MWQGILETNRDAIEESLDRFGRSLAQLREAIANGSEALLWEQAGSRRRKMAADRLVTPRKPDLRSQIDRCDKQILAALGHRMQAARRIGKLKMSQAVPVHDPDRERRMLLQRKEWAHSLGLSSDLIDELFAVIVKHSSRIQTQ